MTALHHLFGYSDGLECTRDDAHRPGHGCTYEASDAPDAHTTSEARQD